MKHCFILILVCALLAALLPALAQEAADVTGEWYSSRDGATVTLTLKEGGAYSIASVFTDEPLEGAWVNDGGFIYLDGEAEPSLLAADGIIEWEDAQLQFTREKPAPIYTPAQVVKGARPASGIDIALFGGYWTAKYAEIDGETVLNEMLGFVTDVYVEGSRAALGGELLGDVIADMDYHNSTLTCDTEGAKVTLQLQQDGYMRLTYTKDGDTQVLYLAGTAIPWLETVSE